GTNVWFVAWNRRAFDLDDIYTTRYQTNGLTTDTGIITSISAQGIERDVAVLYDPGTLFVMGGVYLIVFADGRNFGATDYQLIGARILHGGSNAAPSGFSVSGAAHEQLRPRMARDAANNRVLVVWADRRSNTSLDIYGCHLQSNGGGYTVVEPTGIAIS